MSGESWYLRQTHARGGSSNTKCSDRNLLIVENRSGNTTTAEQRLFVVDCITLTTNLFQLRAQLNHVADAFWSHSLKNDTLQKALRFAGRPESGEHFSKRRYMN